MSVEEILLDVEERMEKAVAVLKNALGGIRTGRASTGLVDSLKVEVYGSQTPIKQLAMISAPEPTQIVIRPFDPSTIKDIERAIQGSDLGLNPQSDGRLVRLNVPPLSTEVRRKLVGRLRELVEESKIAVRNVRRDGNKQAEKEQKEKILSEDERDDVKQEIQDLTKKFEEQAAKLAKRKEEEIMED